MDCVLLVPIYMVRCTICVVHSKNYPYDEFSRKRGRDRHAIHLLCIFIHTNFILSSKVELFVLWTLSVVWGIFNLLYVSEVRSAPIFRFTCYRRFFTRRCFHGCKTAVYDSEQEFVAETMQAEACSVFRK